MKVDKRSHGEIEEESIPEFRGHGTEGPASQSQKSGEWASMEITGRRSESTSGAVRGQEFLWETEKAAPGPIP